MPELPAHLLDHIEAAVFTFPYTWETPTCAFVFGGTHFGAWETTLEADRRYHFEKIFVTGGNKRIGTKHQTWNYGDTPEATIIARKLIEGGVAEHRIEAEYESENTKDNIVSLLEKLEPYRDRCIALIARSYGIGRQARTFRKFCGTIRAVPIAYDIEVNGAPGILRRTNWQESAVWRSIVWGEYLRILEYGRFGDVEVEFPVPDDLEAAVHGPLG